MMERFDYEAGEMNQGATTLVLVWLKLFERASPPSLCGPRRRFSIFPGVLGVSLVRTFPTHD